MADQERKYAAGYEAGYRDGYLASSESFISFFTYMVKEQSSSVPGDIHVRDALLAHLVKQADKD